MTIKEVIELVCRELELDIDILTCPDGCKQKEKYSDGRMIVTYVLRQQRIKPTYEQIALSFGRVLKTGRGDHAIALYYFRAAEDLIKIKHKEFNYKIALIKKALNGCATNQAV